MSKHKVFNQQEVDKLNQIKGGTRNLVSYELVHNFKSSVFKDKKKTSLDIRKRKHKIQY